MSRVKIKNMNQNCKYPIHINSCIFLLEPLILRYDNRIIKRYEGPFGGLEEVSLTLLTGKQK